MKYGLYSIRDIKTGYIEPRADQNDYSAIRNFEHAIMNVNTLFNTHAADFELFKVGEFDSELGTITPCTPELIANAVTIKEALGHNEVR